MQKEKNEKKWKEIENKRGPRNGNAALVVVIDAIRGQEYQAKNVGSGFFFARGSMAAADGATLAPSNNSVAANTATVIDSPSIGKSQFIYHSPKQRQHQQRHKLSMI